MERVLYNSMLSAVDTDGKLFFYTNPLARRLNRPLLSNDAKKRWFTFPCYCCPPNLTRTLAKLNQWAYSVSDEALWVHIYGSSIFSGFLSEGSFVKLCQSSEYPWSGDVELELQEVPESAFSMRLRIPEWADNAAIKLNGSPLDIALNNGEYCEIQRVWEKGDRIELMLPLDVRIITANPLVEELRGMACVMRGPVVYCLESADLPGGTALDEIYLPRDINLKAVYEDDLFGGAVVLCGKAYKIGSAWGKGMLYSETGDQKGAGVEVKFIPYYAWGNRGEYDMSVWLPTL